MMNNITNNVEYHFKVDDAIEFGVNEAILIYNFRFWIMKNKANGRHFYEGRTWTYNNHKSLRELFPFWSEPQIKRLLESLVKKIVIIKGNFNKNPYDKTTWYAFHDEEKIFGNLSNNKEITSSSLDFTDKTKSSHRTDEIVLSNVRNRLIDDPKSDNVIITDNKPDKKNISLLANISPQDVTLDLIKKEANREERKKNIKSFIKKELGKKISGDEYKKLFENLCNNYFNYTKREKIYSYEKLFTKWISDKDSYKGNEPVQQSLILPQLKNPPPPILKLGLADTSKDFINSSEKWQKLLQENFEQDIFDKWIKYLIPHRKEGKEVIFSVKEKFVRDWIIREYQKKIEGILDLKIIIFSTES